MPCVYLNTLHCGFGLFGLVWKHSDWQLNRGPAGQTWFWQLGNFPNLTDTFYLARSSLRWIPGLDLWEGHGQLWAEHLNAFCGFSQSGFTAFYRLPFAGFCFCSRTSSLTYSYHTHTNRGDLSKPSEMNGEQRWQQVQQCRNSKYRCALTISTAVPQ